MKIYFYEFDDNYDAFEFEPETKDLKAEIKNALRKQANVKSGENKAVEKLLKYLVDDADLLEELEEIVDMDFDLEEKFYDKAFQQFTNQRINKEDYESLKNNFYK